MIASMMKLAEEGIKVDLSSTIAVISALLSVTFAIILGLGKIAYNNREKQIDEEFKEMKVDMKAIDTRLHVEEKTTIRQDGDIALTNQRRDEDRNDIQEIKRNMATKSEVNAISISVGQVLTMLRNERGLPPPRYPSGSTTAYSHQESSIEPPRPGPAPLGRRPGSSPGHTK